MKSIDFSLSVILAFLSAVLFMFSYSAEKYITRMWNLAYLFPAVVVIIASAFTGYETCLIPVYAGSALLIAGFIKESGKVRRTVSIVSGAFAVITIPLCMNSVTYRSYDYAEDFKSGMEYIEKHYVLSDYKNIDFDALYDEFLPKFEKVNRSQDEVENLALWTEFCARFNDGHVGYYHRTRSETLLPEMYDRYLGNDYGFSPMTLSDGRTVAVNVGKDSEAYNAGIRNGTVITGWDGVPPDKISDENMKYITFTDKETREFYRTLFCGGTGGESITVGFYDENNNEQTVVLNKRGPYYSGRLKGTLDAVCSGMKTGHMMWEDIDEKTSVFRIKFMEADGAAMHSGEFKKLESSFREKIIEMKRDGRDHIIIDLRDNAGGDSRMVKAMVSVFAPASEEIYYCSDPKWDNKSASYVRNPEGKYEVNNDNYITGKGLWDGKLTILINCYSASAADHFVYVMRKLDNVKVVGFTKPCGSAQGVGETTFENGYCLSFSGSLVLDELGEVFIDSDVKQINKNDIDILVPFDEEAVKAIFDDGVDYLLKKVLFGPVI